MDKVCEVMELGLVPYEQAWQLQDRLAEEIWQGRRPATLLLLEHPHTYTFGRKGHIENLLWDESELTQRGVSVHWVDRGGDVTYHGPGQLVGYPLLPLSQSGLKVEVSANGGHLPQADYVGYLRKLEKTLITALASLGVASGQVDGLTGVWIQPEVRSRCIACPPEQRNLPAKIAAIGVKVDVHGITRHGFALNVDPDMDYWQGIVGCGLKDFPIASLAELLHPVPTMEEVMMKVIAAFREVFQYRMVKVPESTKSE
jgi:lipoate-protein ligase B